MMAATKALPASTIWLDRLRFVLAAVIVWAGLQYVVGPYVLPQGLDRPLVLVGSPHGPLAGALVVAALWAATLLATLIVGPGDRRHPLMVLGLALSLWAYGGGMKGGTRKKISRESSGV